MPGCTRPSSCVSKGSEVSRISPGDKSLAATTGSRFNKRRRREAMLCRRQHLHPDACEGPSLDTPTTTCRSACRRDELAARPIANLGVSASERFAQSHQVTYWLICHPGGKAQASAGLSPDASNFGRAAESCAVVRMGAPLHIMCMYGGGVPAEIDLALS